MTWAENKFVEMWAGNKYDIFFRGLEPEIAKKVMVKLLNEAFEAGQADINIDALHECVIR